MKKKNNVLIETDNTFFIKKEDVAELSEREDFIPLSEYIDNADVTNSFYNVIGFIREKTVIVI